MTVPIEPTSPPTVGLAPLSAQEVNNTVGQHLRGFAAMKVTIGQDRDWLATVNLQAAPYYFSADQETLIKSAVNDLDASLDAIDMTFISRLIGM
jgi:hypothetical protein